MKPFLDSKLREEIEKEIQSDYEEKREIGENDSYLCEMIRSDLIDQFISFVNQQNIFLESKIKPSIFETNSYLIGKEITLIEYAAFFGSCQIFKYLYLNKVRTNRSLWFFAIHSDNPEMVHLLEVSEIRPEYNSYQKVIEESIKCHHNEMANYFLINHLNDKNENFRFISFRYYNYCYFPSYFYDYMFIYNLCPAEKNNIEIINLLFQKEDIEIGTKCFQQCKKLTEITIPSTITEIGDFAFYECSSLKKVVIPSSVTDLGNQSFFICPSLTEITIPSSVTRIGVSLFSGCSSLRQVIIPPSIKTIEKCAFFQCTSLENVTIPSSVVTIGNNAFSGCSSLKDLTIPSSVTSIGESAFKNCSLLCQLSLPSSISAINISTFSCCLSIKEITIPNSVSSVEKFAFFCCSALKKIDIPSSVKSIGESAFDGCTSLTEAFIPNSVTFFGDLIFNRCISLNKLTIPFDADIKAIGIDNHVNVIRVMRPFSIEI
ncbi:hypothetical protein M9Y10_039926 [Tritrichomonas musculus]|uniref:Surface antigen BspA-like protein n=1 Tax=Tritrichomonas musculus TaxID=1915356 RepID=A0ABR2GJU7_9EUKA